VPELHELHLKIETLRCRACRVDITNENEAYVKVY
jgi:hypothetical protein